MLTTASKKIGEKTYKFDKNGVCQIKSSVILVTELFVDDTQR
jgi:hypothetical protein